MDKFVHKTESRDSSQPKKRKRVCTYRKEYTDELPFIKPSRAGESRVFCELCRTDLAIASGGRDDIIIIKHCKSDKHKRAARLEETCSLENRF